MKPNGYGITSVKPLVRTNFSPWKRPKLPWTPLKREMMRAADPNPIWKVFPQRMSLTTLTPTETVASMSTRAWLLLAALSSGAG